MKNNKVVNYLDMIARAAEEERKEDDEEVVMPEPKGEKVVDYLAVSAAWKKRRTGQTESQKHMTPEDDSVI